MYLFLASSKEKLAQLLPCFWDGMRQGPGKIRCGGVIRKAWIENFTVPQSKATFEEVGLWPVDM